LVTRNNEIEKDYGKFGVSVTTSGYQREDEDHAGAHDENLQTKVEPIFGYRDEQEK
jgi:hypothetical protein